MRLSVRGHRAGPSLALGAVALAGAAVALAGCAVVPAPKSGAASHPAGTASSSSGLTAVRSSPKPGKQPTPKQRAVTDAKAILAAFAVPPGARRLSHAPCVDGGTLKQPAETSATPAQVDKAGWWLAPGGPRRLLAWEAAHLPHRFSLDGTGRSGGPPPAESAYSDTFSLPAIGNVLTLRQMLVQVVADGKHTAVRVDAQVIWLPARPASEQVPATARAVTISEDIGGNQGKARPPKPVTITNPAKVGKVIALIDGLPLFPPGEFACPVDFGDSLTLTFRAGPGQPALAVATADLSGCQTMQFTIGGKKQPALASPSGPRILKIAGLPWKIPVG